MQAFFQGWLEISDYTWSKSMLFNSDNNQTHVSVAELGQKQRKYLRYFFKRRIEVINIPKTRFNEIHDSHLINLDICLDSHLYEVWSERREFASKDPGKIEGWCGYDWIVPTIITIEFMQFYRYSAWRRWPASVETRGLENATRVLPVLVEGTQSCALVLLGFWQLLFMSLRAWQEESSHFDPLLTAKLQYSIFCSDLICGWESKFQRRHSHPGKNSGIPLLHRCRCNREAPSKF